MSILFLTGVPRSGKTYRSVYQIWKMYHKRNLKTNFFTQWFRYYFPLPISEVYTYTYTNINQFNFDYNDQIKPLIYKELYSKLEILYDLYKKEVGDDVLKLKAKELKIYDSLFVIDECHNVFDKKEDSIITWWLTYHGHLHQEIHLITQQIKLIPSKYKDIAEFFYKAYPSSKQVSKKNFRYSLHQCSGYYKKDSKNNIFVPFKKDVFQLYVSGKAQKRSNIMTKFLFIIPILFLILFIGFNFFSSSFSSSDDNVTDLIENNVTVLQENSVTVQDKKYIPLDFESETLIVFNCIDKVCHYKDIRLPISFLQYFITTYPPKFHDINSYGVNYVRYTILLDKKMREFLIPQKKGKNENDNNPIDNAF